MFFKDLLFKLKNENKSKPSSELIYGRGLDKPILRFTKEAWNNKSTYQEKELLEVQQKFFNNISSKLHFAKHSQKKFNLEFDFMKDMSQCMFKKIGRFQLIDEQDYGQAFRYYVAKDVDDTNFEKLLKLKNELDVILQQEKKDYSKIVPKKFKINNLLKEMSGSIVQVRLTRKHSEPLVSPEDYFGLYKIDDNYYSSIKGVLIDEVCGII